MRALMALSMVALAPALAQDGAKDAASSCDPGYFRFCVICAAVSLRRRKIEVRVP
jgi:hypothetical protein